VQAWRARFWKKGELSVLIMTFEKAAGGAFVGVVHVGVRNGWPKYYWKPWPRCLGQKRKNNRSVLAAADELDDFVAVAPFHGRFGPCGARQYF
jgi:hypothetical protein